MKSKLKLLASLAIAVVVFFGASASANAQFGNQCHPGAFPAYRASYSYGYVNPYVGYSGFYSGYPVYSSYYAPRVYTGTSLYVGPSYRAARVITPPFYPGYGPAVVTPFVPAPGIRVGF